MMSVTQYNAEDGEILEPTSKSLAVFGEEVNVMVATAQRFRRSKDRDIATKITERSTLSSSIAEECLYSIPRDGKQVTGPSIRFAEIIRSCYNNVWVRAWIVDDGSDPHSRSIKVGALAYDCETNQAESSEVRRSIMTSPRNGPSKKYSADMINTTIMAAQAIAKRNAIIALIPKALWIDALLEVERVIAGDAATLVDRRKKILEDFRRFDVEPAELFSALGIDSEVEIGLNDLPTLRGMWTRLKEGEAAESVLGEQAAKRPKPKLVSNPIANDPPPAGDTAGPTNPLPDTSSSATSAGPGPQAQEGNGTASGSTSSSETGQASQEKPADKPKATRTRKPKDAQAPLPEAQGTLAVAPNPGQVQAENGDGATPPPPATPFDTAAAYIKGFTGPAGALLDWWRSPAQIAVRRGMSFEESGQLGQLYSARFTELGA